MNKQETIIVVLLFALLVGWGVMNRGVFKSGQRTPSDTPDAVATNSASVTGAVSTATGTVRKHPVPEPVPEAPSPAAATGMVEQAVIDRGPERRVVIANDEAKITLSSWGGCVVSAELKAYPAELEQDSSPVVLDFSSAPALALTGLAGLSTNSEFRITEYPGATNVFMTAQTPEGLRVERSIKFVEGYRVQVVDMFSNRGSKPIQIPSYGVDLGPMRMVESRAKVRGGLSYLGLDTINDAGGDVVYWGKKLSSWFGYRRPMFGRGGIPVKDLDTTSLQSLSQSLAWVAAKNKFFVQVLAPQAGSAGAVLRAARQTGTDSFVVERVSATLKFNGEQLNPGATRVQEMSYYVGPKKYSRLKSLPLRQDEVMQFGKLKPLCKLLLTTLNAIYRLIPNYGVAIILLTILIKVIFWPITHRSTQSMKEMQKLQPLVKEVQAKYKSNPQKMNKEVMALYREHKVNPMAGCLPIVIQIPVFISLFTVLRSAVELRFASFLWIVDLSEPEGLLAGVLPMPLNILPLFMTGLTFLQQKLTPSGGDPQQQKMMMIMPLVMLFIFYNMPSALVLYWSTSQLLTVVQLLVSRRSSSSPAKIKA